MLTSVLSNLLANAVKFSYRDSQVRIETKERENEVIVAVKDTGVGIAAGDIEKLFRLETTVSNPGTEDERGTGLGLLIVKELVEKHGGKIWVESKPGKGSTFRFSLPN
jgi:signal transduction histidine kinase